MKKFIIFIFILFYISGFAQKSEYVIFKYPNGTKSSEGYLVNGKPDKFWITYYPSGLKKSEGNRRNFLLDSLWIFFDEKQDTIKKINYLYDKKNGYLISYFTTDSLKNRIYSKELYFDDIKSGKSYYYYPNGFLKEELNYINGKKHGTAYKYAENEQIINSIIRYRYNNIIENRQINRYDNSKRKYGEWIEFYDNKKIKAEKYYKKGLLDGYVKLYSQKGELLELIRYSKGQKVITTKQEKENAKVEIKEKYFNNGTVSHSGTYKNDIPVGIHSEFNRKGEIINSIIYDELGFKQADGIVDKTGKKQGEWNEYFLTGEKKSRGKYIDDKKNGKWTYFYKDGKQEQIGNYINDKPHGIWNWYYANGKLLRTEQYNNGKEDGFIYEFSMKSDTIVNGNFVDGEKNGKWIYKIGDEIEIGEYLYDKKEGLWQKFYISQELKSECKYSNDKLNGSYKEYYENGKIKEKGNYFLGKKEKNWNYYDELGNIIITIFYQEDIIKKIDGAKIN